MMIYVYIRIRTYILITDKEGSLEGENYIEFYKKQKKKQKSRKPKFFSGYCNNKIYITGTISRVS